MSLCTLNSTDPVPTTEELLAQYTGYISERRFELMRRVAAGRTRRMVIILEDIFDPQNSSAVIRTAEANGIQNVHVIENRHLFKVKKGAARGTHKWLDIHRYNEAGADNTTACFSRLKNEGYRICAALPADQSVNLEELPLDEPLAFAFGSEHLGLSPTAIEQADYTYHIPMCGFAESLNISVSAAVSTYSYLNRLKQGGVDYLLSEKEQNELMLSWARRIVRNSHLVEARFEGAR